MISVIVPIYNAAKYLRRCIDSILHQTFADYEIILVDDGSSDDSPKICDEYGACYKNIIVVHKQNQGASVARNTGIDIARGEFLCFVDADDSVSPDYLQNLYNSHEQTGADLIIHGLQKDDGSIISPKDRNLYVGKDLSSFFCDNNLSSLGGPCSKLFLKTVLLENVRFDSKIVYGEDLCFLLSYLQYCTSIYTNNISDYIYYTNAGSVSHLVYNFEQEYLGFTSVLRSIDKLNISDSAKNALFRQVGYFAYRTILSNAKTSDKNQRMLNYQQYTSADLKFVRSNFVAKTLNMKVIKGLFLLKMYRTLDLYLSILYHH